MRAQAALAHVPVYGTREVLVVLSALSTCDPGDIRQAVAGCKKLGVRASVVSLAAELHICRTLCDATGGRYGVALNEAHLTDLVMAHAPPNPALAGAPTCLVHMGFPDHKPATGDAAGAALPGWEGDLVCPRCRGRVKELPSECGICKLALVSAAQLARSYHHLFPVGLFDEVAAARGGGDDAVGGDGGRAGVGRSGGGGEAGPAAEEAEEFCFGCFGAFADASAPPPSPARGRPVGLARLRCPRCRRVFCAGCDELVHSALHVCPGCEIAG